MKRMIIAAALIVPVLAQANDSQDAAMGLTASITMSPYLTTAYPIATTMEASGRKMVIEAREDAAAFIASEGAVETLRLNNAFNVIRDANPGQEISNMDLANFILGFE
jgi:conserverd hypothetical protein